MDTTKIEYEHLLQRETERKQKAHDYYIRRTYGDNESAPDSTTLLAEYAGRIGLIDYKKMIFNVRVLDVKSEYGRMRFFVEPISGTGKMWVQKITWTK